MNKTYKEKRQYSGKNNKYNSFEFEKRLEFYRNKSKNKAITNKKLKKLYKLRQFFCFLLLVQIFIACFKIGVLTSNPNYKFKSLPFVSSNSILESSKNNDKYIEQTEELVEKKAHIISLGSLLCHNTQYFDAKTQNGYDFNYVYDDVRSEFKKGDLVISTFETTIAGPDISYSNYPKFNSPDEFAEAIYNAGINTINNSTNHCLDYLDNGLEITNKKLNQYNFNQYGTGSNKSFETTINNISFSFFSYTEFTNNSNKTSKDVNYLDTNKIIDDLKSSNSDIKIVSLHWGDEYSETYSKEQSDIATLLIKNGANIILGNHPHLIQPIEKIIVGDKTGLVIYSHGNLTSDMKNYKYQLSIGVDMTFTKEDNEIKLDIDYLPLYMYKNQSKEKKFKLINLNNISNYSESEQLSFIEKKDYIFSIINPIEPIIFKE